MRLQVRLSLSYLIVVAIFCFSAGLCWLAYTGLPAYRLVRKGMGMWVERVKHHVEREYARGGEDGLVSTFSAGLSPPDTDLTVFLGRPPHAQKLWGNEIPLHSGHWERATRGEQSLQFPRWGKAYKAIVWAPFQGGVLAVTLPARLPPAMREMVQTGVALSVLLGLSCALATAYILSRRIARPVEKLSQAVKGLGAGDLSYRVEAQGTGELEELAENFNLMADNLQRTVEQQRQFLADVSHNLRTPLAAIQGWTEALQDGLAEEDTLDRIHRQVVQVTQTVTRLLELSRWQSADPVLRLEPVKLSQPLLEAADAVGPAAERRKVSLSLEGELDLVVDGDRERLRDVFQVLMENCVQHGGEGIRVQVRVEKLNGRARVTVEDDGVGSDRSSRPGGMGLSIARRLVEAHGGELLWESVPEQGTRAQVILKLSLQTGAVV